MDISPANESALRFLGELASQHFWGTVALKFEGGTIVHLRQETNLKPSDLSGTPRREHASSDASN